MTVAWLVSQIMVLLTPIFLTCHTGKEHPKRILPASTQRSAADAHIRRFSLEKGKKSAVKSLAHLVRWRITSPVAFVAIAQLRTGTMTGLILFNLNFPYVKGSIQCQSHERARWIERTVARWQVGVLPLFEPGKTSDAQSQLLIED